MADEVPGAAAKLRWRPVARCEALTDSFCLQDGEPHRRMVKAVTLL